MCWRPRCGAGTPHAGTGRDCGQLDGRRAEAGGLMTEPQGSAGGCGAMKRILQALDSAAHFLDRWHLIPGWLLKAVCDRHDRDIWAEFDTTEDEIDAMM